MIEQLLGLDADTSCTETLAEAIEEIGASSDTSSDINLSENENQSRCQYNLAEKKNFIEIINPDGTVTNVRKSTFVWKLLENNGKLSSDRLKRVQGPSNSTEPKRKQQKPSSAFTEPSTEPRKEKILFKATDLEVGEWAIFKINYESVINRQNPKQFLEEKCLIGIILGFKSFNEKGKMIQYKNRNARTIFNKEYKLNLLVLGAWYMCNENGSLTPIDNKKKIKIHMKNYIATMKTAVTRKVVNSPENSKLLFEIPCVVSELISELT